MCDTGSPVSTEWESEQICIFSVVTGTSLQWNLCFVKGLYLHTIPYQVSHIGPPQSWSVSEASCLPLLQLADVGRDVGMVVGAGLGEVGIEVGAETEK